MSELKRTPLYDAHVAAGATMVDFGGWEMPIQYPAGIVTEHLYDRKHCGIFDVSHMGRLIVEGKDAYEAGAFSAIGDMLVPIVLGIAVAFILGLLSARFMLRQIERISYNWFAVYMGLLGIATIILQLTGFGAFKPIGLG